MLKTINCSMFKSMMTNAAKLVEINRGNLDALNVFPVPDGDTGTNMNLTMTSGSKEVVNIDTDEYLPFDKNSKIAVLDEVKYKGYPIGLGCYFAALVGTFGGEIAVGYGKTFIIYTVVALLFYFIVYSFYAYVAGGKKGFVSYWKNIIPSSEGITYKETYYNSDITDINDSNTTLPVFNNLTDMEVYEDTIYVLDYSTQSFTLPTGKVDKFSLGNVYIINQDFKYTNIINEFVISDEVKAKFDDFYKLVMASGDTEFIDREKNLYLKVGDYYVRGRFDALFRNKRTGKWIIIDWKSSGSIDKVSNKWTKNLLGPASKFPALNYYTYTMQLYFYKKALIEGGYLPEGTTFDDITVMIVNLPDHIIKETGKTFATHREAFAFDNEFMNRLLNFAVQKQKLLNMQQKPVEANEEEPAVISEDDNDNLPF